MKKPTILFLNSWYPNEIFPYNGNFIQQHARAVALYCNVACLHIEFREQKQTFEVFKTINNDVFEVIVYVKPIKQRVLFFNKIIRRHKAYKIGLETISAKFKQIDVTHLNVILPAGLFALYLKKQLKIPFIITEHSTNYLKINTTKHGFLEKLIIRKVVKNAAKICPVSHDLKNAMISLGYTGDYCVIPNVVNTSYFKYIKNECSTPLKILHISSLKEAHKNGQAMLRVVKKLYDKRHDFTFTISSDGATLTILEYAKSIGISSDYFFVEGGKTSEEVAVCMQNHHVFMLFSNYENLPCVISEALVCGLPVVASNVGGISEMISSENGLLVSPRDENALFLALNKMIDSFMQFKRNEISQNAIQKYSYTTVGKQFYTIYTQLLNA